MANSNTYIKSRKHTVLAATAIAALSLPIHAQSQTKPAATPTLKEVTVTDVQESAYTPAHGLSSPKFTQPLVNTTQTVTVIKEQLMKEQGATTLTEALRNVPGAGTFYAGENGNTSTGDAIYMRGFDTSSSIFVDGVRDLGSISRDMFNIEQIDVIKGAAGTDFGRSAPTGSINLSTKQPKLEDSFDASLSAGSASYKRSTVDWNKSLEGMGGAAFRLNAMAQDAGVAGRDEVKNDRWGIAPSLAFGLNTDTRTYLNFLHVKQSNVPDGGVLTMGLPGYSSPDPTKRPYLSGASRVNSSNFYGTSSDHDDVTADMVTLRVEHDFAPGVTLRNTSRWGQTKQDYLLSSFMAGTSQLVTPSTDPSTWTITRSINTKDQVNRILTNQTHLNASFETGSIKHDLSTGLELAREEQNGYTLATSGTVPTVSVYHPNSSVSLPAYARTGAGNKGTTDTVALYAFDTLKLNEQWQINGGVRLDHYKTDYDTWDAKGASTLDLKKSGNLFNWKIGALYKPAPNGSIYANMALSQQPPGGANFALSSAANNAANPNMDPQKAKTAELGTKWELFDKHMLVSGALFRTEVTNEIVTNPDGTVGQTGKKVVQGIELGVTGQITPAWGVSGGYTIQKTKVDTGTKVAADGTNGLTYTPKDAFSLWTHYQLPFGLSIGGGARYAGGLKRGTDGAVGTPNRTDSYWVFDAVASYKVNKNFDVQLNVFNLFDKDYVSAINKSGYRYFPGIARSVRLTANVHF
ncbi:catecholate siderophore receptor Fiu (plasmid) [Diaphorobacter sp. HDW4B]|uniref:catecholate siderophore receptor Fiu n=1 Tax=Diaphorobacter sp. HDW4B TaxID=2714925 RepID=UPI001409CC5E|nr:catecholate siderophore receptor Fiu [Diaphorobacter sp. HDW4B]QIL73776.1 catecholate siderophore receptor Fiu [Diaphorobacter sp. HDW4B]